MFAAARTSHAITLQQTAQPASTARLLQQDSDRQNECQLIADTLALLRDLCKNHRMVREGDTIYQAGERFEHLYVANAGLFKIVNLSPDGREQVVELKFRGDWLGLDGIATGRYGCDAVAMDTGEIWPIRYDAFIAECALRPELLTILHSAMSRQIARGRDSLMSICTLPADARVANFLRTWAESLSLRGMRTDQIVLRMTRAEIGNSLGVTLETVSRALARLARCELINFPEKGRREIGVPDIDALAEFVQNSLLPAPTEMLQ